MPEENPQELPIYISEIVPPPLINSRAQPIRSPFNPVAGRERLSQLLRFLQSGHFEDNPFVEPKYLYEDDENSEDSVDTDSDSVSESDEEQEDYSSDSEGDGDGEIDSSYQRIPEEEDQQVLRSSLSRFLQANAAYLRQAGDGDDSSDDDFSPSYNLDEYFDIDFERGEFTVNTKGTTTFDFFSQDDLRAYS
jgi:hypothetical protein